MINWQWIFFPQTSTFFQKKTQLLPALPGHNNMLTFERIHWDFQKSGYLNLKFNYESWMAEPYSISPQSKMFSQINVCFERFCQNKDIVIYCEQADIGLPPWNHTPAAVFSARWFHVWLQMRSTRAKSSAVAWAKTHRTIVRLKSCMKFIPQGYACGITTKTCN